MMMIYYVVFERIDKFPLLAFTKTNRLIPLIGNRICQYPFTVGMSGLVNNLVGNLPTIVLLLSLTRCDV